MKRKAFAISGSILLLIVLLFLLQKLVMPKYVKDVTEGAFIAEYYEDKTAHDVIMLGDCEIYENFTPVLLWEKYGINSYIRGSAKQLMWQSYYLLKDTLKTEKPKVVILSVLALKYAEPQSEAYNRITLDGMRWGIPKYNAIKASMTEEESFIEYLFPLLRYHERIWELKEEDFEYMFNKEKVSHNGYYLRVDTKPAEDVPVGRPLDNYTFGGLPVAYMKGIVDICKKNDIEIILVKAPSLYPYWYPEWEEQVASFADKEEIRYINFLDIADEIGIDYNIDTYDAGLHMNLSGANKLTDYLGKILSEEYGLTDRHDEKELSESWEEKCEFYYAKIEEQTAALNDSNKSTSTGTYAGNGTDKGDDKPFPKKDGYIFSFKGIEIVMDEKSAQVTEALGEPYGYFEAPSCAFGGTDRVYDYGSFELDTYPLDGIDYISAVFFNDDLVETPEGLYIGCNTDDVMRIYGEPSVLKDNVYTYEKGDMRLVIYIGADNTVSLIKYASNVLK